MQTIASFPARTRVPFAQMSTLIRDPDPRVRDHVPAESSLPDAPEAPAAPAPVIEEKKSATTIRKRPAKKTAS